MLWRCIQRVREKPSAALKGINVWTLAKDGLPNATVAATASPALCSHAYRHTVHFKLSPPHWISCKSSLCTLTHKTVHPKPMERLLSITQSFLLAFLVRWRARHWSKPSCSTAQVGNLTLESTSHSASLGQTSCTQGTMVFEYRDSRNASCHLHNDQSWQNGLWLCPRVQ